VREVCQTWRGVVGKNRYVVYEETTHLPLWVTAVLIAVILASSWPLVSVVRAAGAGPVSAGAWIGAGTPALLIAAMYGLFGKMTTQVRRTSVRIAFGYIDLIEKVIPFDEIEDAEAMRYRPIVEFGGWGIRWGWGRSKRAWTLSGNEALVLHLTDGTHFYVGSEHPERLLTALRGVWKPKGTGADV